MQDSVARAQTSSPAKDRRTQLERAILQVILYYDIWEYPLTREELYCFLPIDGFTYHDFCARLNASGTGQDVLESRGYYFLHTRSNSVVAKREERQDHAERLWKRAALSMHAIKRFPFIRAVFVSGDLSKNATTPESDIDFFLVTEPGRLWITRTLLIAFKKLFLLNNRKYFCLNYFAARDHLEIPERNVFIATEIAHLKPLYNRTMFDAYLDANGWISDYFPNFRLDALRMPPVNNRRTLTQWILELPFRVLPSSRIDEYLMKRMRSVWASRYPEFDTATRNRIFRSTRSESRAYAGNYQDKVLSLYKARLTEYGVD